MDQPTPPAPDATVLEDIANWTFPGLTLYYRDTPLTGLQQLSYEPGMYLRNNFFIDTSAFSDGVIGNNRFVIASARAVPMYQLNTERPELAVWQACVINANSYFKVLDVQKAGGKMQVVLLHVPHRWVTLDIETPFELNLEQQVIERARQSFDDKVSLPPSDKLVHPEWQNRTKYAIGLNSEDAYFPLTRSVELDGHPLYEALKKVVNDTSGLDE